MVCRVASNNTQEVKEVTPERIRTFIDRLCAYFPTQIIARNTLKDAWCRDDIFIESSDEDAIKVLKKCEALDKFPNLSTVKNFFRLARGEDRGAYHCEDCGSTGWDIGRTIHEDGQETFHTEHFEPFNKDYTVVVRCKTCHP